MNALANLESSLEPSCDESICCQAEHALQASGYRDLCGLRCESGGGVITLDGQVGSFFLKQMAQTVVSRVYGVTRVINRVHVA